ncbi:MAG: EAL domain-containing protein, partial [Pseudomonadota bacterium]
PILVTIICVLAGYLVTIRFIMPDRPSDIIKRAIEAGEIQPYFQPIVDLKSGQIESFEVLSRWVKQSGHVIGPSEFIAEVERYDLSPVLLKSLILQTGTAMAKLMDRFPFLRFAFNVAPDAFTQPDFVTFLKDMLDEAFIPGDRVIIEVTERQEILDVAQARKATQELQLLGVQVGIDDVGTGHNGLSTITAITPNEIKIDKYFIDGLPDNQRALSMVRMLVKTAHSLGMKTVAEGIENHEQIEALMALKVDYAQGFHIAKPLPADAAIGFFCQQQDHLKRYAAHQSWLTISDKTNADTLPQVTANAA